MAQLRPRSHTSRETRPLPFEQGASWTPTAATVALGQKRLFATRREPKDNPSEFQLLAQSQFQLSFLRLRLILQKVGEEENCTEATAGTTKPSCHQFYCKKKTDY
jgi:hypothetical protein